AVAGVGVMAALPTAIPEVMSALDETAPAVEAGVTDGAASSQPVFAYIEDLGAGRLRLFAGNQEVVIHDRQIASKLARAAPR
ncbi:MAG: hypothetical protein ACRDZY_12780, partial [Acidimicrobiales bacterium]